MLSLSRELYSDFIVVVACVFCLRYLLYVRFVGDLLVTSSAHLPAWLLVYLGIKIVKVVGIAFV